MTTDEPLKSEGPASCRLSLNIWAPLVLMLEARMSVPAGSVSRLLPETFPEMAVVPAVLIFSWKSPEAPALSLMSFPPSLWRAVGAARSMGSP